MTLAVIDNKKLFKFTSSTEYSGLVFQHTPKSLKTQKIYISLEYIPKFLKNQQICVSTVECDGSSLQFVPLETLKIKNYISTRVQKILVLAFLIYFIISLSWLTLSRPKMLGALWEHVVYLNSKIQWQLLLDRLHPRDYARALHRFFYR